MTIGQLSVKYRCERSWHGVAPAVLKSGLQKYVRRRERDSGLWCLIEMDLFSLARSHSRELAKQERTSEESIITRAQGIRTNMINRLVVMISEEVNIHEPRLPSLALSLYQRWQATREEEGSRRHLIALYLHLLRAKKCRIISDYKTIFNLPPYYLPDSQWSRLVALHKDFLRQHDPALYKLNYEHHVSYVDNQSLAAKIVELAKAGSDESLYWCGQLLARRDAKRCVAWIWQQLLSLEFLVDELRALRFFFQAMTHKEQPIYLYHALLLVVSREALSLTEVPPVSLTDEEVAALYQRHLDEAPLRLSEFIKDIHTGKRDKQGRTVFAMEGAHVEDEDETFLSRRYRELYIEFKRVLDEKGRDRAAS